MCLMQADQEAIKRLERLQEAGHGASLQKGEVLVQLLESPPEGIAPGRYAEALRFLHQEGSVTKQQAGVIGELAHGLIDAALWRHSGPATESQLTHLREEVDQWLGLFLDAVRIYSDPHAQELGLDAVPLPRLPTG